MKLIQRFKDRRKPKNTPLDFRSADQAPIASSADGLFPLGIEILHDCPPGTATLDICFVHGFGGDRNRTWRHPTQDSPWPSTLLPEKLPTARILTFGYDAYALKLHTSKNGLADHATSLLQDLVDKRTLDGAEDRPVIFVVHSLGGLVCKEAILASRNHPDKVKQSIFTCTKGIIFLGTPHKGSWMAKWAEIPVTVLGIVKSSNSKLLQTLCKDDQYLESIQTRFVQMLRERGESGSPLNVAFFCEELGMPNIGHVVPKSSAAIDGYDALTIHANHRDMARFASAQDTGFERVLARLVEFSRPVPARDTTPPTYSLPIKGHPQSHVDSPKPAEEVMQQLQSPVNLNTGGLTQTLDASNGGTITFGECATASRDMYNAQNVTVNHHYSSPPNPDACLQSLAFGGMDFRLHDIKNAADGTCKWLLKHPKYQKWSTELQHSVLWILGKPGSGKSTLIKYAFENANTFSENNINLVFFFHDRGGNLQKTPLGLWRSLLHCLLSKHAEALAALVETYDEKTKERGPCGEKWDWYESELWLHLVSALPKILQSRSVTLYVDALDECGDENARGLIRNFITLVEKVKGVPEPLQPLRICFSSRHYPIRNTGLHNPYDEINPENENESDIRVYAAQMLSVFDKQSLRDELHELIASRASGVFMWARLAIDQVVDLKHKSEPTARIRKSIEDLPETLAEIYTNMARSLGLRGAKLMRLVLVAIRPLTLNELRWAMMVDANDEQQSIQSIADSDVYIDDADMMKGQLRNLSCGLAEVDQSGRVQFIHQSVKDWLLKRCSFWESDVTSVDDALSKAHHELCKICVRYISIHDDHISGWKYNQDLFPFGSYSSEYWPTHAKESEAEFICQDDLLECFKWPSNIVHDKWSAASRGSTLLHTTAWYNLSRLLDAIIRRADRDCVDLDVKDDKWGQTPLSFAAEKGHQNIVQQLFDTSKVDPDSTNKTGLTPLSFAAWNGHQTVVQKLLGTGKVNPDEKDDKWGQTPLSFAAERGHQNVVQQLFDTGRVDPDSKSKKNRTPLSIAAWNGHQAVVQQLLDTGRVNPDSKDNKWGQTPLSFAAEKGHQTIVQQLLDTGKVDPDSKDEDGCTPLSHAASNGHQNVVKKLLDTGKVDPDPTNKEGRTPLSLAAEKGHLTVVQQLLDTRKVDPDSKDEDGRTPLLLAAEKGHRTIVQQLTQPRGKMVCI
ncbi:hypothetical protein PgNI_05313 [Pyricularia grisea]|uniref:Uncharacterized protein n=1 Tax=Pyricularia grisea TaxID=148305 RepID=A0A6P8B6E8_PYRGI|nr:hypothetical protein PgNI_05313 [Pyricularia grisea]TLD10694.1 hypothetical protein PgNI_05313 [Pyricularia grisea]